MTASAPSDAARSTPARRWPAPGEAWLLALYALTVVGVSWQQLHLGHVNNFLIFRDGFRHLLGGVSLYAAYPPLDFFKYSPTFALLMAPFALLPAGLGLGLFNAVNVGAFYAAVRLLLPDRRGLVALLLLYFEVLRTTQNTQTNALLTALVVLAFVALEQDGEGRAALAVALGALIKIFPLAAAALALRHRRRVRFFLLLAAALAVLLAVPALVAPPGTFLQQYRWWGGITEQDIGGPRLESLMALLELVVPGRWPAWPVQLAGTALLLLPLAVRRDRWADPAFRRLFLAALLGYLILFNHRAESPTFVIGMTGIVLWYLDGPRRWWHHAVMALAWVLVSLFSEILSADVLNACCRPWHYKTVPVLLAWALMMGELLRPRRAVSAAAGPA